VDLTPRTDDAVRPRRRRWAPVALLGLVGVAGGVIVWQFLGSAIDYYCNVDEIGVRDGCDEAHRLRVQGTVERDSVRAGGAATSFRLAFNGETIDVRYAGDPGGVFQECIAVVAHGRLRGGLLEATRIEVKHSNEYEAEHPDRVKDGGDPACEQAQG
jgi:cytochrome c-type biogenesis protein CcmE